MNDAIFISLIAAYVILKIFDKDPQEILYLITALLGITGALQAKKIYMLPKMRDQNGKSKYKESTTS